MNAEREIFVVVCTYGAPPGCVREDGTRYGPIVLETDVDLSSTPDDANRRAALLERQGYGPCRVGRVVFDLPTTNPEDGKT